ncbi:MAG TPA: hypothetical protein VFR23_15700 [Jiangellaceae bacterium]|nr:hypothetical protein [Jiangellaceae bacterium]
MTTLDQLLDAPRVDEITRQAREVRFGRVLLTVIAAVLFGIGWIVAKTFTVLWFALAWSATAVKLGWQEGRKPRPAH